MNGNVRYLLSDVNFECYEVQMLDNKDVKKARQKFIKDYNFFYKTPSEYKILILRESCVECYLVVADHCMGLNCKSFSTTFYSLRRNFYHYNFAFYF